MAARRFSHHTHNPVGNINNIASPVRHIAIFPAMPKAEPLCNGNSQCMTLSPAVRLRALRSITRAAFKQDFTRAGMHPNNCITQPVYVALSLEVEQIARSRLRHKPRLDGADAAGRDECLWTIATVCHAHPSDQPCPGTRK